ncbi:3-keto-5-aminohexanoate cleavage protein [Haliea sp. E1-2-M8]|uniref:3-keto-5-aminohexanoate cleavage protein n=1 Tax=Haliea sp. E1-2-M8 TaxID=3064706 RepID=UPI00271EB52D|nr:3-keto-5-aminohexanoate cleavage protein [Haliea sp. E1-2-M8]MDO8861181.1 3-keto-5-aminohexanoate cleavage protein [Haliea sp. E1-2-M8]
MTEHRVGRKVIVTCAITGSIYTPTMSPYLPVTGEEIAESSIAAAEAGAAIIHLHARVPEDGRPSAEPEHFRNFISRIDAACDAVLNISTGGSSLMSLDQRLAPARAMLPEMCSLNMGSMNFGIFTLARKYKDWQHEWEPELLEATRSRMFANTYQDIENTIAELGQEHDARFEFECYDMGHIETLAYYLRQGLVQGPLYVQFVLGVMGGIGATPENLLAMKASADRLLGDAYQFSVLAAGRQQMELATLGVILGGNVRVGLEDSLTIPPGRLAESNAEQVVKIRRIIEELGYAVATPDEARTLLQLKGRDRVRMDF